MNKPATFWGQFAAKPEDLRSLEQRPDTIPMSKGEMYLAACSHILRHDYGFVAATNAETPLDANGEWIPLFTYPCIEYIGQFDLRQKRVFEWGAGASTMYLMARAKNVTSVESDPLWFERMQTLKKPNVKMILDQTDGFPFQIRNEEGLFDLIIIDSLDYRFDCATEAVKKLAPGGMIILDNADWYPKTASELKKSGLIQVDFAGFKVTESHTSTTSVFLHREFNFTTTLSTQPSYGLGSKRIISEHDRPYAKKPE